MVIFERKRQIAEDVDDAVALYFIGNSQLMREHSCSSPLRLCFECQRHEM